MLLNNVLRSKCKQKRRLFSLYLVIYFQFINYSMIKFIILSKQITNKDSLLETLVQTFNNILQPISGLI